MATPRDLRAVPRTAPRPEAAPRWDEIDISPAGDPLAPLPDGGLVDIIVTACEAVRSFDGGWRAVLTCDLIDDGGQRVTMVTGDGEVLPVRLPMYIKLPARRGAQGAFQPAPRGSKFYRMWVLANGHRKPSRRDRMALAIFRDRLFRARVHTVTTSSSKDGGKPSALPKELHYSIIAEFIP